MQLLETRVPGISLHKDNDLQHQHDQCECWSIVKEGISKLVLKHLPTIWHYTYKAEAYSKFPQN